MYIQRIQLENIRSIKTLSWELPPDRPLHGWHVILGDNGSGKSTLLRAIAMTMIGEKPAYALRQKWSDWLMHGQPEGSIRLQLAFDPEFDRFPGSSKPPGDEPIRSRMTFRVFDGQVNLEQHDDRYSLDRLFARGGSGWFSAAYGPFRRFAGGDESSSRLYDQDPRLASHLTIFGENYALTEIISWLQNLQFQRLEQNVKITFIDRVREFINQPDFLPNGVRLEKVSSSGIEFIDANGYTLPVEALSDGYRSILSMTFELLRQLVKAYSEERVFDPEVRHVQVPGVVLIDEIDAHLHPSWQRKIGLWFKQYFPCMQFIVTTHSPLICQAAEDGSVFTLPHPGTDELPTMVTGNNLKRLVFGDVLEAYGTNLFGLDITRSSSAREQLRRLAELNHKELYKGLSKKEKQEQQELRATFPTASSVQPPDSQQS